LEPPELRHDYLDGGAWLAGHWYGVPILQKVQGKRHFLRGRCRVINWALIKEPYNWATVILITAFALLFFNIVFPQSSPETSTTT